MNDPFTQALQDGYSLLNQGRLEDARTSFNTALKIKRNSIDALSGMAAVLNGLGRVGEAIPYLEKAAKRSPKDGDLWFNLGILQLTHGDADAARIALFKAQRRMPDDPDTLHALGAACAESGETDQAITHLKRCVSLMPNHAQALLRLGNIYYSRRQMAEAISQLEKAAAADPLDDDILVSLSAAKFRDGDTDGAVAACHKALEIYPRNAVAHFNLAKYLSVSGDLAGAIEHAQTASHLSPEDSDIGGTLYQFQRQAADWDGLGDTHARLEALFEPAALLTGTYHELPFVNIFRVADPLVNLKVAQHRIAKLCQHISQDEFARRNENRRTASSTSPIKLAYLSSDFRDHPTAHLMENFMGLHDRNKFHVTCYSHGPNDHSPYRHAMATAADEFHDIAGLTDKQAAECIAEDDIDILIDLNVHITGERMEICAYRPAPLQVNMLAYPGTSGADFYDYLIADPIVAPSAEEEAFSEKLIRLPHTYFLTNHKQAVSDQTFTRSEFGLPKDSAVFACFNNVYKIEPDVFDAWLKILESLPGSVLWLFSRNETAQSNLRRQAEAAGINGERLIFADDLPKPDHLARLKLADMALDTGIYGGHTTTADALWVGLPVITLEGTHFASRASSSILRAAGLDELVCEDLDNYKALALGLASDSEKLAALKGRTAANRQTHPLFKAEDYCRQLERGFLRAYELWREGQEAENINISA